MFRLFAVGYLSSYITKVVREITWGDAVVVSKESQHWRPIIYSIESELLRRGKLPPYSVEEVVAALALLVSDGTEARKREHETPPKSWVESLWTLRKAKKGRAKELWETFRVVERILRFKEGFERVLWRQEREVLLAKCEELGHKEPSQSSTPDTPLNLRTYEGVRWEAFRDYCSQGWFLVDEDRYLVDGAKFFRGIDSMDGLPDKFLRWWLSEFCMSFASTTVDSELDEELLGALNQFMSPAYRRALVDTPAPKHAKKSRTLAEPLVAEELDELRASFLNKSSGAVNKSAVFEYLEKITGHGAESFRKEHQELRRKFSERK